MRYSHICFDLDGTLVDSASDIRRALNEVLEAEGEQAASRAEVVSWIGGGAKQLVSRAAPHWDPQRSEEALQRFLLSYEGDVAATTRLFPGWDETLDALLTRGHVLSLVTNKPEHLAERLVQTLGMARWLPVRVGRCKAYAAKPARDMMDAALQKLGREMMGTLYVGDSSTDAAFAATLKVPFVAVRWGYGDHEDMLRWPSMGWLDRPQDLLKLIEEAA